MLMLISLILIGMYIVSNLNEKTISSLLGHLYFEDNDENESLKKIDFEIDSDLESNYNSDSDIDLNIYNDVFIKKNK